MKTTMKFKKLLRIAGFCTLMFLSTSSLEAASGEIGNTSSGIAIGYNPADFTVTINGKSLPGAGLSDMVSTVLFESRCSDDSSRSYTVVGSEDPRIMEAIAREMKLSSSNYADPATRITPNIVEATHLAKGDVIVEQGSVTVNLRIEDRQGDVKAQAKVSGPEKSFYELIDEATRSLGYQMCMPEPKKNKGCPYLWDITFKQSGSVNTYTCFGSGEKDDPLATIDVFADFKNVLIWPTLEGAPTVEDAMACVNYGDFRDNNPKSEPGIHFIVGGVDAYDNTDYVYLSYGGNQGESKISIPDFGAYGALVSEFEAKISSFSTSQSRQAFSLSDECAAGVTFTPVPVYGN